MALQLPELRHYRQAQGEDTEAPRHQRSVSPSLAEKGATCQPRSHWPVVQRASGRRGEPLPS